MDDPRHDGPPVTGPARRGVLSALAPPPITDPRELYEFRRVGPIPAWALVALVVGLFVGATLLAHAEYRAKGTSFGFKGPAFNALIAPIYEELIFRGWILGRLAVRLSPAWAIAISSALFGIVHLRNIFWLEGRQLAHMMLYAGVVLGPLFGYVALRCRSAWPAVILHYLNNMLVVVRHW